MDNMNNVTENTNTMNENTEVQKDLASNIEMVENISDANDGAAINNTPTAVTTDEKPKKTSRKKKILWVVAPIAIIITLFTAAFSGSYAATYRIQNSYMTDVENILDEYGYFDEYDFSKFDETDGEFDFSEDDLDLDNDVFNLPSDAIVLVGGVDPMPIAVELLGKSASEIREMVKSDVIKELEAEIAGLKSEKNEDDSGFISELEDYMAKWNENSTDIEVSIFDIGSVLKAANKLDSFKAIYLEKSKEVLDKSNSFSKEEADEIYKREKLFIDSWDGSSLGKLGNNEYYEYFDM